MLKVTVRFAGMTHYTAMHKSQWLQVMCQAPAEELLLSSRFRWDQEADLVASSCIDTLGPCSCASAPLLSTVLPSVAPACVDAAAACTAWESCFGQTLALFWGVCCDFAPSFAGRPDVLACMAQPSQLSCTDAARRTLAETCRPTDAALKKGCPACKPADHQPANLPTFALALLCFGHEQEKIQKNQNAFWYLACRPLAAHLIQAPCMQRTVHSLASQSQFLCMYHAAWTRRDILYCT